jgi:uncharacterized protein (TIGR02246 family)
MSRKDVESGERAWLAAFNGGDAAGVRAIYAENARLLPPGADTLQGHDALEEFIKGFIATGAKLEFELIDVHERDDLCVSVGKYRMTIPGAPDDHGKFIEVWARQDDGDWRIVDDIFNSSIAPPA